MSDIVKFSVRLVFQRLHDGELERCVIETDYGKSHPTNTIEKVIEDGFGSIVSRAPWHADEAREEGWNLVMFEVWPGVGLLGQKPAHSGGIEEAPHA